ncbi:MAG: hypothetical protein LUG89_02720 [Methanosphaera sp.]|nr:hypothetical protein [Methanosphaera sp.]
MGLNDIDFRLNWVSTLIGCVFALYVARIMYAFSFIDEAAIAFFVYIAIIIIGVVGAVLYNMDYRISLALYIVCTVASLATTNDYAILSCICFLVSTILAYYERDGNHSPKFNMPGSNNNQQNMNNPNGNYYNNNQQNMGNMPPNSPTGGYDQAYGNQQGYPNQPMNNQMGNQDPNYYNNPQGNPNQPNNGGNGSNKWIWAIPVVLVIILVVFGVFVISGMGSNSNVNVSSISITYDDNSIAPFYEISCNMTPLDSYDYIEMYVELYDSSNTLLDKSLVWNMVDAPENQPISIQESVYSSGDTRAHHAVIYIYDDSLHEDEPLYNVTVNLTN